jgi:hypothetical protein
MAAEQVIEPGPGQAEPDSCPADTWPCKKLPSIVHLSCPEALRGHQSHRVRELGEVSRLDFSSVRCLHD